MITVQNLTRRFGAVTAVADLSFQLERGDVVGFLGPNGAGKTTTMRMLTGFLPATSGRIEIAGLDVLRDSLAVRRKIGYLPESVPLYREHRVRELLVFQARLHRMPRAEGRRRADAVLERVGILDRASALFGKLSKGQRQRVGLAMALLHDPEVLILDEPTSGLDPLQRLAVRELIGELASERTVLVSSHILPEIEAVCPRVIILDHGRIVAQGASADLVAEHGGASCVHLEAVVGDGAEAARLLAAVPGVTGVEDRGRLGIHQVYRLACGEDLREDVGALAAHKGWALRELSFERPTLEAIFARIALGLEDAPTEPRAPGPAPAVAPSTAPGGTGGTRGPVPDDPQATGGLLSLGAAPEAPSEAGAAPKPAGPTLSPFERGPAGGLPGGPGPGRGTPRVVERPEPADPEGSVEPDAEERS